MIKIIKIMIVKNKSTDKFNANDLQVNEINPLTTIENLYVPTKSKETRFIDGNTDEIVEKITEVLKNEIKVMN